jgi:hypothetical protein
VYTVGLGINPQGCNASDTSSYLSPSDPKYTSTTEYDLKAIANTSGGEYFYAEDSSKLGTIFQTIQQKLEAGSGVASRSVEARADTRSAETQSRGATVSYLLTPTFNLTGTSKATLEFYHKYNLILGSNGGLVQVGLKQSGTWSFRYVTPTQPYTGNLDLDYNETDDLGTRMRWCWNGVSDNGRFGWEYVKFDLTDFAGYQIVRVKFVYFEYKGGDGLGGWWIDSVKISSSRSDELPPTQGIPDMWDLSTFTSHRGNYSWGLRDPATGYLPGGVDSSLWTQPIDLTNARNATLTAYFKFNINCSAGRPPDGFRLEMSQDNGVSWEPMSLGVRCAWGVSGSEGDTEGGGDADGKSYTGISTEGNYWVEAGTLTRLKVDLSGWIGEVVKIRLRVVTASDENTMFGSTHYEDGAAGFGGFFVDDFIVYGDSIKGEVGS